MIIRSLDELVGALPPSRGIIGIAGAPGSGKSTIAAQLVARLGPSASLLPMDGFHLPQAELRRLGRRERMGAPDTFDTDGFALTLASIRSLVPAPNAGVSISAPGFDRVREEPVPGAIVIPPHFRTVVVEGNYLLLDSGGWQRVAPLLDLTFIVEVEDALRLERLVARHERFGKSSADARAWATGPDEVNARLVAASAHRAQHVIRLG